MEWSGVGVGSWTSQRFIYWKMQFAYQFEWEQCNRDSNDYATEQQLLLIADPTGRVLVPTNATFSTSPLNTRAAHLQTG